MHSGMDMSHGHGGMDMGDSGQCDMNVGSIYLHIHIQQYFPDLAC